MTNCFRIVFSIHICLTYCHTAPGVAERFVSDVTQEVASLLKNPNKSVSESVRDNVSFSIFLLPLVERGGCLCKILYMYIGGDVWLSSKDS